jgi:CBS domain-containing protein
LLAGQHEVWGVAANVLFIRLDQTLREAANLMLDEDIGAIPVADLEQVSQNMVPIRMRRLPVMSRDRRLVGIISLGDLAMATSPQWEAEQALHGVSQSGI